MAIDSPLLNETGCYVQEHPLIDKSQKETFDVLWVGKLDFRKQLGIALLLQVMKIFDFILLELEMLNHINSGQMP